MYGEVVVISLARIEREKCSLFNCIALRDGIKINERYKSIGIGPVYLQTDMLQY